MSPRAPRAAATEKNPDGQRDFGFTLLSPACDPIAERRRQEEELRTVAEHAIDETIAGMPDKLDAAEAWARALPLYLVTSIYFRCLRADRRLARRSGAHIRHLARRRARAEREWLPRCVAFALLDDGGALSARWEEEVRQCPEPEPVFDEVAWKRARHALLEQQEREFGMRFVEVTSRDRRSRGEAVGDGPTAHPADGRSGRRSPA